MSKTHLMISIDKEILDSLEEMPNKSGFINQMLVDYFNSTKDLNQLKDEKTVIINQMQREIEEIEARLKKAKDQEEAFKNKKENSDTIKQELDEYWKRVETHQKEAFLNYDIPKADIESQFDTYMRMLRNKGVRNIIEFMELNGFKRKGGVE